MSLAAGNLNYVYIDYVRSIQRSGGQKQVVRLNVQKIKSFRLSVLYSLCNSRDGHSLLRVSTYGSHTISWQTSCLMVPRARSYV